MISDGTLIKLLAGGEIVVDPLDEGAIQPSSVDLRLGENLRLFQSGGDPAIDPERQQDLTIAKRIPGHGFYIDPGEFLLAHTLERVEVGSSYAVQFTGRSSLARLGLSVHQTAGHIDPGFEGVITLEIQNVNVKPIKLRTGMPIGQILVFALDQPCVAPYGDPSRRSRYFGQSTVTESRFWM